jgi:hypothetical protein
MSLDSLPSLFEPWREADTDKLTVDEAVFVYMHLEKKMKIIEDRVERHHHFLRHNKKRYQKIFNFTNKT